MLPLGIVLFLALAITASADNALGTFIVISVSVIAFANAIVIGLGPFLARRAASRVLGVKVTYKNYPPNDPGSYIAWCRKNNIEPNKAMTNS
jgi:hypothetical protein